MKSAFKIVDLAITRACLDFAKSLGLSVDEDNYDREIGNGISIGTSKNYTVAGTTNSDYYSRKHNLTVLDLDVYGVLAFISTCLSHYDADSNDEVVQNVDAYEVNSPAEDPSGYNEDAIYLLVARVRKMKKAVRNYYVIEDEDGDYLLTTNGDKDGVIGNLERIFDEITASAE